MQRGTGEPYNPWIRSKNSNRNKGDGNQIALIFEQIAMAENNFGGHRVVRILIMSN